MLAVNRANETEHEGKYRTLVELGQGGTANVYLSVQRGPSGFNKLIVIKALKKNLSNDPEFRNMFLNEARLAARLNHRNIVQTNEVVEEDGVPFIVMEYLEGQPLSNVLIRGRNGAFSLTMHLRTIVDALAGLHYAHNLTDYDGTQLGVVHRDMTPHNIFVTYDGQIKVLDFGIAKLNTSTVETQTGVIKGKLRYMPPEQIAGEEVDRRADIYAVGVMLWEAAAGQRMWKGQSDATIMNRVLNGEVPPPSTVNPEVPPALEQVVMKALSSDKNERYADAAELEMELERVIAELGTRVSNREVGQVVSTLFEDVREKTKALVDTQLAKVATMSWTEYQSTDAPTMTFSNATSSMATTTDTSASAVMAPRSKAGRVLLVLLLLLVAGGGAFMWNRHKQQLEARRLEEQKLLEQERARGEAQSRQEEKKNEVFVRISAFPKEAKLFLDDRELNSNPFTEAMPADGSRHIVKAVAEGYVVNSTGVVLNKDVDVTLILQRLPQEESTEEKKKETKPARVYHPRTRTRPRPSRPKPVEADPTPPPATKPKTNSNCNPPYIIDDNGIKKYKMECL